MKVKELIRDTIWQPSAVYSLLYPKISVLLPTYCRAQSGFLKRAVDSILCQSFSEFELIIVDDGSTDGTKQLIRQYMQQDDRISCLTHLHNIGLPAVSEYEAFLKAKGEYIIFAFDDFIFEPDAFAVLYEAVHESNYQFCHGLARLHYFNSLNKLEYIIYGRDSTEPIFTTNSIANASVIIKKTVLDEVGLYDPHLVLTRICDWDLWKRIVKKYPVKAINVIVGNEYGVSTKNSLDHLYPHNLEIAIEYMTKDRDKFLLPDNFSEFVFDKNFDQENSFLNFYFSELLQEYQDKTWFQHNEKPKINPSIKLNIIFYGSYINYFLCFSHLNSLNFHYKIKIIKPMSYLKDLFLLKNADIIIFDRNLDYALDLIKILRKLNIHIYYFTDDNLIELRNEDKKNYEWYTIHNMREALKYTDGIIATTEPLKKFFLSHKIHRNIMLHGPVLDLELLKNIQVSKITAAKPEIVIAIIGGMFRQASAIQFLLPALNKLSKQIPITLYARKGFFPSALKINFCYKEIEFKENYYQFLHYLNTLNIDIIIHPAGKTCNLPYKTNSILLTAFYLNTNIIVTEEPVFSDLSYEHGIVKCQNTQEGYIDAIKYIKTENHTKILKYKLRQYCLQQFSSKESVKAMEKITKRIFKKTYLNIDNANQVLMYALCDKIEELKGSLAAKTSTNVIVVRKYLPAKIVSKILISVKSFLRQFYVYCDLTEMIQPQFNDLLSYSKKNGFYKQNYYLTVSRPIHNKMLETCYFLPLPAKALSNIELAFDYPRSLNHGRIGIKIEVEDKHIQICHEVDSLDFNQPIIFSFEKIYLSREATAKIRIFCHNLNAPLHVYEFRKKGFQYKKDKMLFCSIS